MWKDVQTKTNGKEDKAVKMVWSMAQTFKVKAEIALFLSYNTGNKHNNLASSCFNAAVNQKD